MSSKRGKGDCVMQIMHKRNQRFNDDAALTNIVGMRGASTTIFCSESIYNDKERKAVGGPKEIRTPSLLIRSQVLYPVELWVRAPIEGSGNLTK